MAVDKVGLDVRAKFDDSLLNSGRIIGQFDRPDAFHALLCSISLHLAAERKQLVSSYRASLWASLSPISGLNFGILA